MAFGLGPRLETRPRGLRARALVESGAWGIRALRWCDQVHGTLVASLSSAPGHPLDGAACAGRCDGLMTEERGLALAVWTADCVPVLMAGGGVVAAVHSGWRGTAAGIVPRVVRRIEVEYGVPPAALSVGLGPAIGGCCYEVGEEVVAALDRRGVPRDVWFFQGRVDLRALLCAELASAGIPAGRIERIGGCTACSPDLASYRRDGATSGRQLSLVVLEEPDRPLS